ncbi:hypothetical protein M0804_010865 [Polistes exclamans]|nr:hypothetical protein M0804_010865 [Polistes exclamans]
MSKAKVEGIEQKVEEEEEEEEVVANEHWRKYDPDSRCTNVLVTGIDGDDGGNGGGGGGGATAASGAVASNSSKQQHAVSGVCWFVDAYDSFYDTLISS